MLEYRKVPEREGVPSFEVTYPDQDGSLIIKFQRPVSFKLRLGRDQRSLILSIAPDKPAAIAAPPPSVSTITTPVVPVPVPEVPVTPPAASVPAQAAEPGEPEVPAVPPLDLEGEAKKLLSAAKAAIIAKQWDTAIQALNQLLNLPPNTQSQEAQDLAGQAREGAGDVKKAIAEYELYLKLYPAAPAAARIKERLAALRTQEPEAAAKPRAREPVVGREEDTRVDRSVYGGLSMTYYNGASKTDTTNKQITLPNAETLTTTDQSALVTSLDFTARTRTQTTDSRIVFRDTYSKSFLDRVPDRNRLTAAYAEHEDKRSEYKIRVGRQSPSAGGVLERFDGATGRYRFSPSFGTFLQAGVPAELDIDSSRFFYGAGFDLGKPGSNWNAGLYAMEQRVDGITDRRAVGTEMRFFKSGSSVYSLIDYDIYFGALNVAMLQGNWQITERTGVTFIADRRKSPSLQIANALAGETTTSIDSLLDSGVTAEGLKVRARALAADSNLGVLGLTHTVNARWQVGMDYSVSSQSSTQGGGLTPPSPGSGNNHAVNLQAIRSGLFLSNDIAVMSVSYNTGATYAGWSMAWTQQLLFKEKWRVEPAIRYYAQEDDFGTTQSRITSNLRLSYRIKERFSVDAEGGMEWTRTETTMTEDSIERYYFSLGFRWDFQWL